MTRTSEPARQIVHIGVGGLAVLLRWLDWYQAAAMAIAAVAFNRLVLPSLGRTVFRDGDLERPWSSGIVLYPLAVLGLIVLFQERLDLVAAAWGILAAGDGVATLVGTTIGSRALPWNRAKSIAGTVAFFVAGSIAAAVLLAIVGRTSLSMPLVLAAVLASAVAALVETIPIRLNDNVSVPLAAAGVLLSASVVSPELLRSHLDGILTDVPLVLAVNALVAVAGLLAATVTPAGAATGWVIGSLVALGSGWAGWAVLIAAFLVAAVCTRVGRSRKAAAGIDEARGGRRGPGNALANTGLAAWLCGLATGVPDPEVWHLAAAAALITAGSDTVASEIGKAYGRTTLLVTTWRRVPPGTTGAISLEGTAAGVVAAAGLAALAAAGGLLPWVAVPTIVAAATLASLLEGVVGATWEAKGILNNDMVNFVNSATGATLAVVMWSWL